MVNIQMVQMKKGNVPPKYQNKKKKKNRFGNGQTFDSVTDRLNLFIKQ